MQFVSNNRNLLIGILLALIACVCFFAGLHEFNIADEQSYLAEMARTSLTDSELASNSFHRWISVGLNILFLFAGVGSYMFIDNYIDNRRSYGLSAEDA